MREQCIQAVNSALGRELSQAELAAIESRIMRHMRQLAAKDREAWLALTQEQRFQEAAKNAAREFEAEQAKKAQRLALQILANARINEHLSRFAGDKLDGLARVIAFHADGKSQFLSIESTANAIEADALRQMIDTLEASNPKFFGLFENTQGVNALIHELFGEDSGNIEAKAGAREYHKVAEALRVRFNRAGGDIGKLEDWAIPQHHAQMKVAQAGADKWIADIMPYLDRNRYVREDGLRMNDAELNQFLRFAWESIATGGVNKLEPGRPSGIGMRANRGNASRQIHFANADAYLAYQRSYGERSAYEVMVSHIRGIARDIALVETLGPNPNHAFQLFRDTAVKEAMLKDPTRAGKIQKQAVNVENLYNLVSGRTLPVASQWLAKSFDTLRSWLVASRLGSAVISSFSDEATLYLTAHVNQLPMLRVFANELAALNPANTQERRLANLAGLALNSIVSDLNRFGQEGLGSSFSSKLSNTVIRASGLQAITEARRRAFGITQMGHIGAIVREAQTLLDLHPQDRQILTAKGITELDFAIWRRAQLEDWGGGNDTMLTPESIYRIPDADLAELASDLYPNMPKDARALKERAVTRLLAAILEETSMAVIEPGVIDKAVTRANLQRGTWKGELARSFFLFKSFPLAMIARHWMRGHNMPTMGGRAAYIARLIAGTTVMGAASLQVNELLSGRDPRNLNPFEGKGGLRNWGAAMLKGGSLGLYGDLLFNSTTRYGQSPVASIMGPVIGELEDFYNLTWGNMLKTLRGEPTHAGADAVRFVKGNTPGASLWYAKGALDHLIFHNLQEYFSPGYLARMKTRTRTDFDQKFWWEPGEAAPARLPDVAAMVGDKA